MPRYTISTIALRSANGKYVCIEGGRLVATGEEQRDPESNELRLLDSCKFKLVECEPGMRDTLLSNNGEGNLVGIQTIGGGYVTAPIKETKKGWFAKTRVEILPLTAGVSKLDIWERFVLVNLGNGNIALQAHNGKYVCAEGGGGQHLIADRDQIGPWETFVLLKSYISVSGDHWHSIGSDPIKDLYKTIATGVLTVLKVPAAKTIVDVCFDFLIPEDVRSQVDNKIRSIAKDEVAKAKRSKLMSYLSTEKENWDKYSHYKTSDIKEYREHLESIEDDVTRHVNESIELDRNGRYVEGSGIETLLYTFECFGQLSLLHLALLRELVNVSSEQSKLINQSRLDEKKSVYQEYARNASNKIIEDRLSYLESIEKNKVIEETTVVTTELIDRYYDYRNPLVVASESYNDIYPDEVSRKGSIEAYRTLVRNRLASQHATMIPNL